MKLLRFAAIATLLVAAAFAWRASPFHPRPGTEPPSTTQTAAPRVQNALLPAASNAAPLAKSPSRLGPFSIAGRDYTIELQTRKVQPGSTDEQGDTVVAMEIEDAAGTSQYRKTFPYQETDGEFSDSWAADAQPLIGTNGTGLLVSYSSYSEPSAPEEEPTAWFQVFGILGGKFVPFGDPLEIQGGLLDQYGAGHAYKAARPVGTQADIVEFKVWSGHCRLVYPVRVDWGQGKLTPDQECGRKAGGPDPGCQYQVLPEDKLSSAGTTFVRLWPDPDEKSARPVNTLVKTDSKVDLLTARVPVRWVEGKNRSSAGSGSVPFDDATVVDVPDGADVWIKVRIDGKEGWIHSEEDFRSLGLPEDE